MKADESMNDTSKKLNREKKNDIIDGSAKKKTELAGELSTGAKVVLIILPLAAVLISLCVGRVSINPMDVFKSIGNVFGAGFSIDSITAQVLWGMRLPRILLALLTGAGLAVSGCAFQGLFSNPLATPDTLGVASGSSFGAALALLFGQGLIGVQVSAMIFGLAAVSLTYISGNHRNGGLTGMILGGIMIGSLFSALVSLVKYVADVESQLPSITYWLMGNLNAASYPNLMLGAPVILIGILILFLFRWRLNILPLSEDEASASGINIKMLRVITVLCATAITAACVSMCGLVGWVGLLVPHICRMKFGNNNLALIPASICVGAAFLVVVDTVARSASAAEIPISILTAIIGAPFFILIMKRSGGWQL